ncbi:MAG: exodeoxyribonuclease VII large subunit [Planctomycetota bacterium]
MTGRLPFNPERLAGPAREPERGSPGGALSVRELATRIAATVEGGMSGRVRVMGEISGLRRTTHAYFTLKDEDAAIGCAMFASALRGVRDFPPDGTLVLASGRVRFYEPQGRIQLYVETIETVGVGGVDARFRALCDELRALGWFDDARKRPLPTFPRRIAVITSSSGAALRDVIATAAHRCAAIELLTVDVRVQGDSAAREVTDAIRGVGRIASQRGIDAIIVTRGGGSVEDLWAFNDRTLAKAVLESPIPVVAAIGHETDTTIVELVADERASTPTQAAMRLVPDAKALLDEHQHMARRLRSAMQRLLKYAGARLDAAAGAGPVRFPRLVIDRARDRVQTAAYAMAFALRARVQSDRTHTHRLSSRLAAHRPDVAFARRASRVEELQRRLTRALRLRLERCDAEVFALERELHAVSPMEVLARGYSITTVEGAGLLRATRDATAGQTLVTRLADGTVRSVVESESGVSPTPPRKPRPKRRARSHRDHPSLFDDAEPDTDR